MPGVSTPLFFLLLALAGAPLGAGGCVSDGGGGGSADSDAAQLDGAVDVSDVNDGDAADVADSDESDADSIDVAVSDATDVAVSDSADALTDAGPTALKAAPAEAPLNLDALPLPRFVCRSPANAEYAFTPGIGSCPPPPGFAQNAWDVRRVFEPGYPNPEQLEFEPEDPLHPPDLETGVVCTYDWRGPMPATRGEQLEFLPTSGPQGEALLAACEGDAPVVVPMAIDKVPAGVSAQVADLYLSTAQQAGALDACPIDAPELGGNVTVAIVDSVPLDTSGPIGRPRLARSTHGTTMSLLVRDLSGPAPDGTAHCGADILQVLALDLRYDEAAGRWVRDADEGGEIGTLTSVAAATWSALRYWRQVAGDTRLILNYSIGWTPTAASLPCGSLAADAALMSMQAARKRGALLLAAAGNRVAGPDPGSGPMLPAGFEVDPTGAACALDDAGSLVFGVAGVRSDTELLDSTRPQSVPRLVAWGQLGVGDAGHLNLATGTSAPPFPALAGTSVATAVTSAAAAAYWAGDPSASADEVYEALWERGTAFGGDPPDVCPAAGAEFDSTSCGPPPRRVQLCRAAAPGAAPYPVCYAEPMSPEAALKSALLAAPASDQTVDTATRYAPSAPCAPDYLLLAKDGEALALACPEKQVIGYENSAYAYPKPGDHGCDSCLLSVFQANQAQLDVRMNPRLGAASRQPRLLLTYPDGRSASFYLGVEELKAGQSARFVGWTIDDLAFERAQLITTREGLFGRTNVSVDELAYER